LERAGADAGAADTRRTGSAAAAMPPARRANARRRVRDLTDGVVGTGALFMGVVSVGNDFVR
jgi:hypothetical protein